MTKATSCGSSNAGRCCGNLTVHCFQNLICKYPFWPSLPWEYPMPALQMKLKTKGVIPASIVFRWSRLCLTCLAATVLGFVFCDGVMAQYGRGSSGSSSYGHGSYGSHGSSHSYSPSRYSAPSQHYSPSYSTPLSTYNSGYQAVRHYFSPWTYDAENSRYLCCYWYKTSGGDASYRCHYCVYQPQHPGQIYYYSPYSSVYYGCYDTRAAGYCALPANQHNAYLSEIASTGWSQPHLQMPTIPGSNDGQSMLKPPAPPE